MEILNEDKTPAGVQTLEEVEAALSYPPNNAILGSNSLRFPIPFGLWIYNDFVKYQDKRGWGIGSSTSWGLLRCICLQ